MNLAYALLHKMNMNLIQNIASFTASHTREQTNIERIKLENKRANAKYEYLRKAQEK